MLTGSSDVRARPLAQHVGYVADPLYWSFALVEVKLAAVAPVCVIAGESPHDAEEFIIAAAQRAVAGQIPQMPFAD
jgi:hypothetical protein